MPWFGGKITEGSELAIGALDSIPAKYKVGQDVFVWVSKDPDNRLIPIPARVAGIGILPGHVVIYDLAFKVDAENDIYVVVPNFRGYITSTLDPSSIETEGGLVEAAGLLVRIEGPKTKPTFELIKGLGHGKESAAKADIKAVTEPTQTN